MCVCVCVSLSLSPDPCPPPRNLGLHLHSRDYTYTLNRLFKLISDLRFWVTLALEGGTFLVVLKRGLSEKHEHERVRARKRKSLRWHVCRVNFARKIFVRATNFLTKNAPKFSPKFLSLCSVGQKKIPGKFPPNFPLNCPIFPAKNQKKIHRRASAGAQGEQVCKRAQKGAKERFCVKIVWNDQVWELPTLLQNYKYHPAAPRGIRATTIARAFLISGNAIFVRHAIKGVMVHLQLHLKVFDRDKRSCTISRDV